MNELSERSKFPESAIQRFWSKVTKSRGCWSWSGSKSKGYGHLFVGDGYRTFKSHRFAYELLVGPIPAGLVIDHLCCNKGCVNPKHMEPVTIWENTLRAGACPSAQNVEKKMCKRGHPFIRIAAGTRMCEECRRIHQRKMWPIRYIQRKARKLALRVAAEKEVSK